MDSWLLSYFATVNIAALRNTSVPIPAGVPAFSLLEYIPRSGIAESSEVVPCVSFLEEILSCFIYYV